MCVQDQCLASNCLSEGKVALCADWECWSPWPWESFSSSLSLNFHIYEMEVIIPPASNDHSEGKMSSWGTSYTCMSLFSFSNYYRRKEGLINVESYYACALLSLYKENSHWAYNELTHLTTDAIWLFQNPMVPKEVLSPLGHGSLPPMACRWNLTELWGHPTPTSHPRLCGSPPSTDSVHEIVDSVVGSRQISIRVRNLRRQQAQEGRICLQSPLYNPGNTQD